MTPKNLVKSLKKYNYGWVALNSRDQVVYHAESFAKINELVKVKKDITLMPVLEDYSRIITNG